MKKTIKKNNINSKRNKTTNKSGINWEKSKGVRFILIAVLMISIGILFGSVGYSIYKWNVNSKYQSRIISVNYVNTSIQIVSYGIGINADKDSLKFGKTSPGGSGERALNLNSTEKAIVKVTVTGDMAKFLSIDKNEFIIEPDVPDKVMFYLDVPTDTTVGNYTGSIQVLFLKP